MKGRRLVLVLLVQVLLGIFCAFAGRLLVRAEEPEPADCRFDRSLYAIDLYRQGLAGRIVIVQNRAPGYEYLADLGVELPRDPELVVQLGRQLGVPEEAFLILPGDAASTRDEARAVTAYLEERPEYGRLLLVTSHYHSARAAAVFRRALRGLGRPVNLLSCPTPYDGSGGGIPGRK